MARIRKKHARPGLHTIIEDMAERIGQQADGASHVVYVILDPTQPDPLGQFKALPIYVGVTRRIRRRVKQHFRCAAYNEFGNKVIYRRLRNLLLQNVVAEFEVIERFDTKLDAMIAETMHAQRLLRAGYTLCNRWFFQRYILTEREMEKVVDRIRYAATMETTGWD